jgi:hypothetical protein
MKNPWTKKNPLLSMWLSGANAVAGSAEGKEAALIAVQGDARRIDSTKPMKTASKDRCRVFPQFAQATARCRH